MTPEQTSFETGVIRPFECLREGWELVRERYWFLVGVCLVAMLMNMVPIVLIGPAVCGLSVIFLGLQRRQAVVFDQLFRGFDHFVPSLIVALVLFGIQFVLMLPLMLIFFGVVIFAAIGSAHQSAPGGGMIAAFIAGYAVFILGMMLISTLTYMFTFFAFPLLVERKLEPMDALRLSYRAVKANLWPLAGLFFLVFFLAIAGMLCCYVGFFLVAPLAVAAVFVAYRKIFPEVGPTPPPLPPEPAAA